MQANFEREYNFKVKISQWILPKYDPKISGIFLKQQFHNYFTWCVVPFEA